MTKYASLVSTVATPQNQPIIGKKQTKNNAGGYVFKVDCWERLNRFLILGSDKGSFYVNAQKLTRDAADSVLKCASKDLGRTIETICQISETGRAPKNDPAIFALALLCSNAEYKSAALNAMHRVCRTGTHLFQFLETLKSFSKLGGETVKRAISNWYLDKTPEQMAYQVTKYQNRSGWSHKDAISISHPKFEGAKQDIAAWLFNKEMSTVYRDELKYIYGLEAAKNASTSKEIVQIIQKYDLVRECVPNQFLNSPEVWESLLEKMPMTAMVRNLGKMSQVGLLKPMSKASQKIVGGLTNREWIKKSRIHPVQILLALKTYERGRGFKGNLSWNPVPQVVDALDDAFYLAFDNVEPTNKRWYLGVDVSGSMGSPTTSDMISCAEASAAMALLTAKTESQYYIKGFSHKLVDLGISAKDKLNTAINKVKDRNFGGTDCSLPMIDALNQGIEADVFVVYTDNETWAGNMHPFQALQKYRDKMGIDAKLIVCAMQYSRHTIADPNDPGMLDVVGFDASVPVVMSDFVTSNGG